jgi:hypothetical protein
VGIAHRRDVADTIQVNNNTFAFNGVVSSTLHRWAVPTSKRTNFYRIVNEAEKKRPQLVAAFL